MPTAKKSKTADQKASSKGESETVAVEKEKTKRSVLTIILVVAAIVLVPLLCCGGMVLIASFMKTEESTTSDEESDSRSSEDSEDGYEIGDEVEIDDLILRITNVKNLGNSIPQTFGEPITTTGTFLRVDFQVENTGKETAYLGEMQIIDSESREYDESSDRYSILGNNAEFFDKLSPDVTRDFSTVFEIPLDAEDLELKVHGFGIFNTDYEIIDLGMDAE